MSLRDELDQAAATFVGAKKTYTGTLTAIVDKINAKKPVTNADWTDLIKNFYDPMTVASDALRVKTNMMPILDKFELAFTTAKKAYTQVLTALVDKVNAKQPVTNADWTDLVVNLYDPMTKASDALRYKINNPVEYGDGALSFYHMKHGATIGASGPGDIPPGGAFLVDNEGDPATAAKYEFGKAHPDGNFDIMRNGTPFNYTGVTVQMNQGHPVIINKKGDVVYGTAIDTSDVTAHLT